MSKRTIVKDASYTAHAIDMISIIIFNSPTDCTLTLPSPTGLIYTDCDVHNKGAGTVTIGTQTVATGSHAHISNDGAAWVVVVGGGGAEITKEAIEAVLTGEISTHFHRTKPQQWKGYPDSPEEAKAYPYQMIDLDGDDVYLDCFSREAYTTEGVQMNYAEWQLSGGVWVYGGTYSGTTTNQYASYAVASNYNIYTTSEKTTLVYARQNDDKSIPTGVATYYEPLVNGDPAAPEIMFDDSGDIIMVEV